MAAHKAPTEHLLTPADVAALVFVDPKTVSRWARKGRIASTRTPGGHRRFRSCDVQTLMSEVLGQGFLRTGPISTVVDRGTNHLMPQQRPCANGAEEPWATRATGYVAADATADAVVVGAVAIVLETQAQAAAEAVLQAAASVAAAAQRAAFAAGKARRARAFAAGDAAEMIANEAVLAAAMRSLVTAQAARLADAAVHVVVMVAAFDLSSEREATAAQALPNLTLEIVRDVAQRIA